MNEDIKKIGLVFKGKREEMNLSLKEIEISTSIRANYLEAIECGQVDKVLSSVYVQGFIRQYASFLGLDIDKMMREHPLAFKIPNQKYDFEYGLGTLEMRGSLGGGVKWLPNLIWMGVSAVVLFLAWYFMKALGLI